MEEEVEVGMGRGTAREGRNEGKGGKEGERKRR